ncbi:MAG: ATP-binding protein [Deltaproteobacteria bacterium]|nr:ATP-binding protein [Deltaproteobacteria bacterium]
MVFLGGPRQVGKTTLALGLLDRPSIRHPAYLNWDDPRVRPALLRGELPPDQPLLVLDEIHKAPRWRNLVKGLWDTRREEHRFLVTGSARLDLYGKGGDSLHGRYHYHRLHPFSLPELGPEAGPEGVAALLRFGGFPEPLLRGEERFWRRWQRERTARVIHDDIRDLETVREIALLDLLAEELPHRVGSPLSYKNLAEALQVSHETAVRWIAIFERMYVAFLVPPWGHRRIRAVRKEQKLYLWDWSMVPEEGPRFENLVASHLLKFCHFVEDTEGHRMELRYLRDTAGREVDFVVLRDRLPLFTVECKLAERTVAPALFYFASRLAIPRSFQVHLGRDDHEREGGIRVLPFPALCRETGLI